MEQRWSNSLRMTLNEKKFIEAALLSELRVDGRRLFDYRNISIKFGREDGSSDVQLGKTHVMGFVTAQLVQPYRDRPNEGTLSIFTEFSPMADPSFEVGRPGESAVELGRIIDRGLRESRAVDTESLCVLAGKLVWSIRIDLHILDNGGNLVDASNIAALSALLTFRRPECTLDGEDGQEVIVHPPEVREPLPLIVHHLPIAVTFAFIGDENIVKAGGMGVMQSVIMQCLRIASVKAGDITSKIKNAVELYNTERALRKIKRHSSSVALDITGSGAKLRDNENQSIDQKGIDELSRHHVERLKLISEASSVSRSNDVQGETQSSEREGTNMRDGNAKSFIGGPSSTSTPNKKQKESIGEEKACEAKLEQRVADIKVAPSQIEASGIGLQTNGGKTLKDAVKPKNKRKKKASSTVMQLG